jgi:hypothetical protein
MQRRVARMKPVTFDYDERIKSIIGKTMRKYWYKNIPGMESIEYMESFVYSEEIPTERMLSDVNELCGVFAECAECARNGDLSFDDVSAVFTMICTCCVKHNLDYALGSRFKPDVFLTVIGNEKELKFLSALGQAILGFVDPGKDPSDNRFQAACELYPDNEIINLYRFIGLAEILYADSNGASSGISSQLIGEYENVRNRQEAVKKDMHGAYSKLSETLIKYAIVDEEEKDREVNLPFLLYASYAELFTKACLSDFRGISEGACLTGNEQEGELQPKIIGALLAEEFGKTPTWFAQHPVKLNLIHLFTRLQTLQRWEDTTEVGFDRDFDRKKLSLLQRKGYLALPCMVEPRSSTLRDVSKEAFLRNIITDERDRAIEDKNSVIRDFTHTYGNMKANGLYGIAQALLKKDDIESKQLGRQVLLEYGIKQDLTKAVYMMRLRFEGNAQDLRKLLQDSISDGPAEDSENIEDIISSAMQLSLLRVFYDTSDKKANLALSQVKKVVGSLNSLRDSFEKAVIFGGENTGKWASEHITHLELSISKTWEQLVCRKESYATVFLKDILAECFFNVLKYADLKSPVSLLLQESESDLVIRVENAIAQTDAVYDGVGLASKNAMLGIINGNAEGRKEDPVKWGSVNGNFRTTISLEKSVLKGA